VSKATIIFTDTDEEGDVSVKLKFTPEMEADGSNATPAMMAALKAFELFVESQK
jgi:hypothetical protein